MPCGLTVRFTGEFDTSLLIWNAAKPRVRSPASNAIGEIRISSSTCALEVKPASWRTARAWRFGAFAGMRGTDARSAFG